MRRNSFVGLLFLTLLPVPLIWSCAGPVSEKVRNEADENLNYVRVLENPAAFHGAVVIWGGVVISAANHAGESALFLWETPLDLGGRPEARELSEGMFIARTSEFLDPQIFVTGCRVTIAGEIIGQQLGEYQGVPYVYPVVKIREIHVWKEEPAMKWNWGKVPFYVPDEFTPDKERRGSPP